MRVAVADDAVLFREGLARVLVDAGFDLVGQAANAEAASQKQHAEFLAEQLEGFADATEEAEQAAKTAVGALEGVAGQVRSALPKLAAAGNAVIEAERASAARNRWCSARRWDDAAVSRPEASRTHCRSAAVGAPPVASHR